MYLSNTNKLFTLKQQRLSLKTRYPSVNRTVTAVSEGTYPFSLPTSKPQLNTDKRFGQFH